MAKEETGLGTKLIIIFVLLLGLSIIGSILAATILLFGGSDSTLGANVAIIPVEGVLMAGYDQAFNGVTTSDQMLKLIDKAEKDKDIKAVIFRINSPGGSAVASDEIATAIKRMGKPSVAVIREVGASGAYWVATATDHVIANRMSVTGSIGVIGSYVSFGRFLEHWNVTYNQLISGDMKDIGTPYRELDDDEKAYLQEKLDKIHWFFTDAVATNRNKTFEAVEEIADGRWFLGYEAKDLGLIDQLGGEQEALDWINATLKIEPVTTTYEQKTSLLQLLAGLKKDPLTSLKTGVEIPMAK